MAEEETLRSTIGTMLMSTFGTHLGSVSWINLHYSYPACLGFVGQEAMQLGKRPAMQAAFVHHVLLAAPDLGSLTNVGEVFQNNGTARCSVVDKAFGEDMVVISSLPKPFPRELAQVAFRTLCAFGLKDPAETKNAAFLFLPSSLTQEVTLRGHSRTVHTQVNPDHFIGMSDNRDRNGNDNMEKVAPLAIAEVSRTDLATAKLRGMLRNGETHLNAPGYSSKTTGKRVPLDPGGTLIITDRSESGLWSLHRLEHRRFFALLLGLLNSFGIGCLMFLGPRERRFDGFGGLDTSSTNQLSWKVWIVSTQIVVGLLMQFHPIAALGLKAQTSNRIEASRMLVQRALQEAGLRRERVQWYDYRSIHAESLSYIPKFCQEVE